MNEKIKKRIYKPKLEYSELIKIFWEAPLEAYFDQFTIAPVICSSERTLEQYRWEKKIHVPFRKVSGRILYQKKDVVNWIESHKLVTSSKKE